MTIDAREIFSQYTRGQLDPERAESIAEVISMGVPLVGDPWVISLATAALELPAR